jgi:hypothetical protein
MKKSWVNIIEVSLFLILLLSPISGFTSSDGGDGKEWMTHIQAYIEADRLMVSNGIERKETFFEDIQRRSDSARRFDQGSPPTLQEIEGLLESPLIEERVTATVAVMLSKKYSPTIMKSLVKNLSEKGPNDQNLYELKGYTKFALKKAPRDQLKQYEQEIFKAIDEETNENLLFVVMTLYTDLSPQKSAVELTQLLIEHPSTIIKKTAYALLHKLGEEHRQQAISALKQRGDQETLKLIETWDGK